MVHLLQENLITVNLLGSIQRSLTFIQLTNHSIHSQTSTKDGHLPNLIPDLHSHINSNHQLNYLIELNP